MATLLTILSSADRKAFDTPPKFAASDRKQFFHLPVWAEAVIDLSLNPVNQVGLVLQLGYFRAARRFYAKPLFRSQDIQFVSRRLHVTQAWQPDAYPETTRLRHRELILKQCGYQAFTPEVHTVVQQEIEFFLTKQVRPKEIFVSVLEYLEQKKIEIPNYHTLANLITGCYRDYEKELVATVETTLRTDHKVLLDELLTFDERYDTPEKSDIKQRRYTITRLKKLNQSTKPLKIYETIEDLKIIQALFHALQPAMQSFSLSPLFVRQYATAVLKSQIFQLTRRDERRYLYLLAFIIHQYYSLQDTLIDAFLASVRSCENKVMQDQRLAFFAARMSRSSAVTNVASAFQEREDRLVKIRHLVFSSDLTDAEIVAQLRSMIGETSGGDSDIEKSLKLLLTDSERTLKNEDYYDLLEQKSLGLQKRVSDIIKQVTFNDDASDRHILKVLTHFKAKDGDVGNRPPLEFLEEQERKLVIDTQGRLRTSFYKALLFIHTEKLIRSGGLNLKHSYKYKSLDEYLIPKDVWKRDKASLLKHADLLKFQNFSGQSGMNLQTLCIGSMR